MKYVLLFFSFIILPSIIWAQWIPSNRTALSIYSHSFLNSDTLLIASNGMLLKSYTGGQFYDSISSYPTGILYSLTYKNIDTIFAPRTGTRGFLISTDGGATWQTKYLLLNNGDTAFKKNKIVFLGFFDESRGIIIGDTANGEYQIFLTEDGGQNWSFYTNSFLSNFNSRLPIDLANKWEVFINMDGFIKLPINNKSLLTIKDYGKTWELDTLANMDWTYRSITFKDELNGLATVSDPSSVFLTWSNDGGKTWSTFNDSTIQNPGPIIYVKESLNSKAFYLSATFYGAFITYDDGVSWEQFDSIRHQNIFFYNAEKGISVRTSSTFQPIYYYNPTNVGLREQFNQSLTHWNCYPNPAQNSV